MTPGDALATLSWWARVRPEAKATCFQIPPPLQGWAIGYEWPDLEPEQVLEARVVLGVRRDLSYDGGQ